MGRTINLRSANNFIGLHTGTSMKHMYQRGGLRWDGLGTGRVASETEHAGERRGWLCDRAPREGTKGGQEINGKQSDRQTGSLESQGLLTRVRQCSNPTFSQWSHVCYYQV